MANGGGTNALLLILAVIGAIAVLAWIGFAVMHSSMMGGMMGGGMMAGWWIGGLIVLAIVLVVVVLARKR